MKGKKKELDVDFIGGQTSLTKEQEHILKEYFQKIRKSNVTPRKGKSVKITA